MRHLFVRCTAELHLLQQVYTMHEARISAHSLVGHEEELVPLPHNASLALAHGNSPHVLVLVDDGHPEGGQGVPGEGVCVVQDLKQGAPSVPGALLGVDCLLNVVS